MSTFEELKKKVSEMGYMSLNMEERKAYSENLKVIKGVSKPESEGAHFDPVGAPSLDDRIAGLERLVENLSNENSNLREETSKLQEGWAEYKPVKGQNKTATLKVYRQDADSPAGLVTKLTTFKHNAFNEETRKNDKLIYSVTLRYDDGKTEDLKVDAAIFAEIREVEAVEIIKEDSRTLKKVENYAIVPDRDKDGFPVRRLDGGSGYGRNVGSTKVPLEIFRVESTVTVRRRNGQEFSMESNYLNL